MNTAQKEVEEFGGEFLNHLKEKEAWSKLSDDEDFDWTMVRIEKYADQLDWEKISENRNIQWDFDTLEKYKTRIIWEDFSRCFFGNGNRFNYKQKCKSSPYNLEAYLEKFSREWDWTQVSRHIENINPQIIDQFIHRWDWNELIDNEAMKWTPEKFKKYQKYIPISKIHDFSNSKLWDQLIELRYEYIKAKVILDS